MSTARWCLKSPHYPVHPSTPPWSHKGQCHGHEWTTHIPLLPCQSGLPFLKYGYFKLWPWNFKVKVMGVVKWQDYVVNPVSNWFISFLLHINQTNNSWDTAILKFDLEISKVKVICEVKGQCHIVYPVSNQCTSFLFHVNRTIHSWDMANRVFDLEKTHPKFWKIFTQNIVADRISPKSREIYLASYVVIETLVLT